MGITNLRVFQGGVFKQAKFLFSSPARSQKAVIIDESGIVSLEVLPLEVGWMNLSTRKMAWLVKHQRKFKMEGQEDPVLLVSERDYLPLDPFNRDPLEDDIDLKEIARIRHAERRAKVVEGAGQGGNDISKVIAYGVFIIIALVIIIVAIT